MSDAICYRDAYARAIEAQVVSLEASGDGPLVRLDRTTFYPGGGGQPCDVGTLLAIEPTWGGQRWQVRAAKKAGDDIVHVLDPDDPAEPPEPGSMFPPVTWAP